MELDDSRKPLTIDSIAPLGDFELEVSNGFVNRTQHPDLPYEIWNYSKKTQFDRHWNPITKVCRGLITNSLTGEIVARPFPKFFNAGEDDIPIPWAEPIVVTEKVDGSLGIVYPDLAGGLQIATRGSFASDQALHATGLLRERYGDFAPPADWTFLFEIVYPENRIVINYEGLDDLILLGAVEKDTGRSVSLAAAASYWSGPVATVYPFKSFAEIDRNRIPENREGFVVHFQDSDLRLKVKSDWYFNMHRLMTGTSPKTIWENLVVGLEVEEVFRDVPGDFREWALGVASHLRTEHARVTEQVETEYAKLCAELGGNFMRKEFAARAAQSPWRGYLFAKLDGKDISPMVWRNLKPKSEMAFVPDAEA